MTAAALPLTERVLQASERVRCVRVRDGATLRAVAQLRYRAYRREGAIEARSDELFLDPVDDFPNTRNIAVYVDERLAAAIRVTISEAGLPEIPTASVFPEILRPRLAEGERIVDPTRFVADAEVSRAVPELPYIVLRIPWLATEHWGASTMLAAVRDEHRAFYRRLWGNETLAEPRHYPRLAKPVALTALDVASARDRVLTKHPFFASTEWERSGLFGAAAHASGRDAVGAPSATASGTIPLSAWGAEPPADAALGPSRPGPAGRADHVLDGGAAPLRRRERPLRPSLHDRSDDAAETALRRAR